MVRKLSGTLLLVGALLGSGCDNVIDNPIQPTEPGEVQTRTFEGTITTNGASTHTFEVAGAGSVSATLTEVTPDDAIQVGFALGTFNTSSNTCQSVISRDDAVEGQVLIGSANTRGTLCVRVHDPASRLTAPLNYKLTVTHQ